MKAHRILVPLDGSEMAEAALAPALEMAHAGSSLILMRAADARVLPGADVIGAQIRAVREAEDYLGEVKEELEKGAPGAYRDRDPRLVRPGAVVHRRGRQSPESGRHRDELTRPQRARADHLRQRCGICPA